MNEFTSQYPLRANIPYLVTSFYIFLQMKECQLGVYQQKRVGPDADCVAWSRVVLNNMYTWAIMLSFDTHYVS
jgi:hypothetical protein